MIIAVLFIGAVTGLLMAALALIAGDSVVGALASYTLGSAIGAGLVLVPLVCRLLITQSSPAHFPQDEAAEAKPA